MKRFIFSFIVFLVLGLGGLFTLKTVRPAAFDSLLLSFDMTPASKEEKARLDKISMLTVSEEKKKILSNRTIFLGASTNMVELALGEPIQKRSNHEKQPTVDQWVYYFTDDSRPTVLTFEDSKLTEARKVSAHKLNLSNNAAPASANGAQ